MPLVNYNEYEADKGRLLYSYEHMIGKIKSAANSSRIEDLMLELLIETVSACLNTFGLPEENIERKLSFMDEVEEIIYKMRRYRITDYAITE